jgi:antitoxin PrlF
MKGARLHHFSPAAFDNGVPWHAATCRLDQCRGIGCQHSITLVMYIMAIAQSKVTAQGQISVPAEIRKRLGIGPGSVLEWDEEGDRVIVRRVGRFSSADVHAVLFPENGSKKPVAALKDAVRTYVRKRHARG